MNCDDEIASVLALFTADTLLHYKLVNSSHGEQDFRETAICELSTGQKLVLKIVDNDFTSPDRIAVWQRCAEEYRKLGYYCPEIFTARDGRFPIVAYKNRHCVAFAEEYSVYACADTFDKSAVSKDGYYTYINDALTMNARVAAAHFTFAPFPSAYCAFEKFCPSDTDDEVTENALAWLDLAKKLPGEFAQQVDRIWGLWSANKEKLRQLYPSLPTSVFQADLNTTNILLDADGQFKGVLDFNICGKEVFVNYLFREAPWVMTVEGFYENGKSAVAKKTMMAIEIVKKTYSFSDEEIEAAPLLYRYHFPLWIGREALQAADGNNEAIKSSLCKAEAMLTEELDWSSVMRP